MLELAREERTCLPLWGKWIEIWNPIVTATRHARVFPCGGSGLKSGQDWFLNQVSSVFPCGGSGLKYFLDGFEFSVRRVSSPVGEVD